MIDLLVVASRIIQFLGATVLFGAPAFLLYGLESSDRVSPGWPRPLLFTCAVGVMTGALVSLSAQTAAMAGDPAMGLDAGTLASVLTDSAFGMAILVRVVAAMVAVVAVIAMRPGRRLSAVVAGLGALVLASLAWSGHGAAEDGASGWVHAVADILHLLAAGAWLGALAVLAIMGVTARGETAATRAFHRALVAFSGVGIGVVATILATGLVNSWFLVGPDGVWRIGASTYGRLLLVKLGLFLGMLVLAAANRFRLTPNLAKSLDGADTAPALRSLRLAILAETGAGGTLLVVVAWLGTLAPVSAQ